MTHPAPDRIDLIQMRTHGAKQAFARCCRCDAARGARQSLGPCAHHQYGFRRAPGRHCSTARTSTTGDANWRLEDGVVVADKGNGFLVSKDAYADFQIRAEFWVDDDANSGIFIRCTDPAKVTGKTAYEVNIWDRRPDPTYGTGAIVEVAKVSPMPKAAGKWNVYEITAKGSSFTVTLNGQKTVDGAQDAKFASGRIALQHGLGLKDDKGVANDKGVVKFRKVEIRPL